MKIENVKVYDIEESFKASKYPMSIDINQLNGDITPMIKKLATTPKGEGHDQFLTGIRVAFDLTFTNKAWVEAARYRFLEFVSSQSTMHRITKFDLDGQYIEYVDPRIIEIMKEKVALYNEMITRKEAGEDIGEDLLKKLYLEILYSNPAGFKLTARMTTNYRCLRNIYIRRRNHRLPEWRAFCRWIETLPYANIFLTNINLED